MESTTLVGRVQSLLRDRPRSLSMQQVANATDLPLSFLYYIQNKGSDQTDRIQTLYEYLTEQPLLPLERLTTDAVSTDSASN